MAVTRAAASDDDWASAARKPSSASASAPGVEVGVRQHGGLRRIDQCVLGGGIQLDREHTLESAQRVPNGALHLRQRPEGIRVLDGRVRHPARDGIGAEQLAHPRGDRDLPRMRPGVVHARVEHDRVGARAQERERGHAQRAVE